MNGGPIMVNSRTDSSSNREAICGNGRKRRAVLQACIGCLALVALWNRHTKNLQSKTRTVLPSSLELQYLRRSDANGNSRSSVVVQQPSSPLQMYETSQHRQRHLQDDMPLQPLVFLGVNPSEEHLPLGLCHGDCDRDQDCAVGLRCQQRGRNYPSPPGCIPNEELLAEPTDFCIQADETSIMPLSECRGDCDWDADCAPGLMCVSTPAHLALHCFGLAPAGVDQCVPAEATALGNAVVTTSLNQATTTTTTTTNTIPSTISAPGGGKWIVGLPIMP